jgi:hypothetical protein
MSASGKGIYTALAISNAIANLPGTEVQTPCVQSDGLIFDDWLINTLHSYIIFCVLK